MIKRLIEKLKASVGKEAPLGQRGEDAAARFLEGKGYRVVERNFSTRYGEVDIICRKGGTLVFVEVKTRGERRLGEPLESVGSAKRARIMAAAKEYLQKSSYSGSARFDVIGIVAAGGAMKVEHIEDAFTE